MKWGVQYRLQKKDSSLRSRTALWGVVCLSWILFHIRKPSSTLQSIFILLGTVPLPHDAFRIKVTLYCKSSILQTLKIKFLIQYSSHKNPEKSAIIFFNYINPQSKIVCKNQRQMMFVEAHAIIGNTFEEALRAILAPWVNKQHSNQHLPTILVAEKSKPTDTGRSYCALSVILTK